MINNLDLLAGFLTLEPRASLRNLEEELILTNLQHKELFQAL